MIITTVQCEMCSNQFKIYPQQRPREWDVPEEWLTVYEGNPHLKDGLHFCSSACLRVWATQKDEES